jgi:hypothetical protein
VLLAAAAAWPMLSIIGLMMMMCCGGPAATAAAASWEDMSSLPCCHQDQTYGNTLKNEAGSDNWMTSHDLPATSHLIAHRVCAYVRIMHMYYTCGLPIYLSI